ncbi:FAD-dependent monooxygenase [Streptomyces sp. NPDC058308]|uniref:NAD(P)/FAD-dependent oxidoreductase n=1 Tax=Streptomyces sp. NPDC058308 TaxID=3346440 RepID=UPI0036ED41AE
MDSACAMVCRSELAAALPEAAAAANAEVRDGTALTALEQQGDTVTVRTNRGDTLRARAVTGADGSAGPVSRYVGVRCAQVGLALEVEVPVDERTADRWRGRALMGWGRCPAPSGGSFPRGMRAPPGSRPPAATRSPCAPTGRTSSAATDTSAPAPCTTPATSPGAVTQTPRWRADAC